VASAGFRRLEIVYAHSGNEIIDFMIRDLRHSGEGERFLAQAATELASLLLDIQDFSFTAP
jgi:hypothetical protein